MSQGCATIKCDTLPLSLYYSCLNSLFCSESASFGSYCHYNAACELLQADNCYRPIKNYECCWLFRTWYGNNTLHSCFACVCVFVCVCARAHVCISVLYKIGFYMELEHPGPVHVHVYNARFNNIIMCGVRQECATRVSARVEQPYKPWRATFY